MENIRDKKMIWVDGNTLVRVVGEAEERDYLHGSGFQAKLTAFIKERDRKLKEEEALRKSKLKKKAKTVEPEPGNE